MKIWHTRTPDTHEYPIWAYMGNAEEVVLLRKPEEYPVGDNQVTWSPADIPNVPTQFNTRDQVDDEFQRLANSDESDYWCSSDWFRAGYEYALDNLIEVVKDKPF